MSKLSTRGAWLIAAGTCALLLAFTVPESAMPPAAARVAAVAILMAALWITEAIPIPATALLPVVLFPVLDVMPVAATTANYANHLVFLFLGGFLIAAAVQRCGLHRRIALALLRRVGERQDRMVLGFMAATGLLSMWLSNTATAMMMLPIALAVTAQTGHGTRSDFGRALMLGIAYSASIGGVATLIGTPPNAVLAGIVEKTQGVQIGFAQWLAFGFPLAAIMLLICWWYLTRVATSLAGRAFDADSGLLAEELASPGPIRRSERRVLAVFGTVAFLWVFRPLLPWDWLAGLSDSTIAVAGAIALFALPSGDDDKGPLLDWPTAAGIPWDVLILFGGGFALAEGFQQSGLTGWIGEQLGFLEAVHWLLLAFTVALLTVFLTEVTSNTATASMLLPIVAGLAAAAGQHPLPAMVATALAASFAFMLPVATPPNAIVFASREITIAEMARAGIWMNLIGLVLIVVFVGLLLPAIWDIRP
jgi:sodium-dependent dicarboxylate transporter 2/3/5